MYRAAELLSEQIDENHHAIRMCSLNCFRAITPCYDTVKINWVNAVIDKIIVASNKCASAM